MSKHTPYKSVRIRDNLHAAWKKVYSNGIRSQSKETKEQVLQFAENAYRNLERIGEQLRKNRFQFAPSKGAPIRRPGKSDRPIVIAPIANRIVQRSILEVLQDHLEIQKYVLVKTSYGGVKDGDSGRRVRDAIAHAYNEMENGRNLYIRSDIKDFFTKIDRAKVLSIVSAFIDDKDFLALFDEALATELDNLAELGSKASLFPIGEIGVAQGCCLSPLVGNILLHDFDVEMNRRGIVCLRYIDDFLLLGNKKSSLEKAFTRAQGILSSLGLSAYTPDHDKEKANFGKFSDGLEFLGCSISHKAIAPSHKSRKNLIAKIELEFKNSMRLMASPGLLRRQQCALTDTLSYVSDVLEGWGNQYSYCNCMGVFEELDNQVDTLLAEYLGRYATARKKLSGDPIKGRQLLGVHPLTTSYNDSIIPGE